MNLKSVDGALTEFLNAPDPRVIALAGSWGRGKTFYWRSFLEKGSAAGKPGRQYAYVSLFGTDSLQALKDAIFENAVPLEALHSKAPADATSRGKWLGDQVANRLQRLQTGARRLLHLAENVPKLGELGPFLRSAAFLTVSDYLVCIDDLERRADSLPLKDVLGLVTFLRDQRSCRVLVILNIDALDADRAEFDRLREKVFDYEIHFEPDAVDCAAIALPADNLFYSSAAGHAIALGIRNIRVLFRIRRLIDVVSPFIDAVDPSIVKQVIHSAVLLGWIYNERGGDIPPYEYVRRLNYGNFLELAGISKPTPEEKEWNARLAEYGYRNTDELDGILCDVLERGYVDEEQLAIIVRERQTQAQRVNLETAFHDAWGIFHGSFGNDAERLVEAFRSSLRAAARFINIENASATTALLRSLGYAEVADELMHYWIEEQRTHNPAALNVEHHIMGSRVQDKDFYAAAKLAYTAVTAHTRSLRDAVEQIATSNGWSDVDEEVLAAASELDYYNLFRSLEGDGARTRIRACLRFAEFGNASPRHTIIAQRARAALVRVGNESELNRQRVLTYGIDPASPDGPEEPSGDIATGA